LDSDPAESPGKVSKEPSRKPGGPGPRVELRRLKQGKGGKTVTEIQGLAFLGEAEGKKLLKTWKSRFGVGGTWRQGTIEIQGDLRDPLAEDLQARGFKAILAGG